MTLDEYINNMAKYDELLHFYDENRNMYCLLTQEACDFLNQYGVKYDPKYSSMKFSTKIGRLYLEKSIIGYTKKSLPSDETAYFTLDDAKEFIETYKKFENDKILKELDKEFYD